MDPRAGRIDSLDPLDDAEEVTEVEVTRTQIEQTRSDIGGTLDAIKAKLQPQALMQQAKETVHDMTADVVHQAKTTVHDVTADVVQQAKATLPEMTANAAHSAVSSAVNTAKEAVGDAVDTAKDTVSNAVDTAKDAGSSLLDMIKQNPVPAALIGLGLGWLVASNRRPSSWEQRHPVQRYTTDYRYRSDRMPGYSEPAGTSSSAGQNLQGKPGASMEGTLHQVQAKVGQATEAVQDQVSALGAQARDQARGATDWFQRTLQQSPLAVGAMALGLGAAAGFMVPETYQENRIMGEARDQLVDKARETAQDLASKVQTVAEETLDTAREKAQDQGLTQ